MILNVPCQFNMLVAQEYKILIKCRLQSSTCQASSIYFINIGLSGKFWCQMVAVQCQKPSITPRSNCKGKHWPILQTDSMSISDGISIKTSSYLTTCMGEKKKSLANVNVEAIQPDLEEF